jgi:RHS repeat-associated protein
MTTKTKGKNVTVTGDSTKGNTPGSPVAQQMGALVEGAGMGMSSASDKADATAQQGPGDREGCEGGEPVDLLTGTVVDRKTEFKLPGVIPFEFRRIYSSEWAKQKLPMGFGWTHNWHQSVSEVEGVLFLRDEHGRYLRLGEISLGEQGFQRSQQLCIERHRSGTIIIRSLRTGHIRQFQPTTPQGTARLCRLSDPYENAIVFHYQDELLTSITDTAQRTTLFRYSEQSLLEEICVTKQDKVLLTHSFGYHESGELKFSKDAAGNQERYLYDIEHRLIAHYWKNGVGFYYRYDPSSGRCIKTWGDDGLHCVELTWNDEEHTVTTGGTLEPRVLTFDQNFALLEEATLANDYVKTYTYDKDGLRLTETNGAGHCSQWMYDSRGFLIEKHDPAGNVTRFEVENDLVTKTITPDGLVTEYIFNEHRLPETIKLPSKQILHMSYDQYGRMTKVADLYGQLQHLVYDDDHNIIADTNAYGGTTHYAYDALGRATEMVDPYGATTRITYNILGQPTSMTFPNGTRTEAEFNELGQIAKFRDASGTLHHFTYAGTGVLIEQSDSHGNVWKFRYDLDERLRAIINPKHESYELTYDRAGRVIEERFFDGRSFRYSYDMANKLLRIDRPDDTWRQFRYNPQGQLVAETSSHGQQQFIRDELGRIVKAITKEPKWNYTVSFERDDLGRVVKEVQGNHSILYTYDDRGLRNQRVLPNGETTSFHFDAMGNLSALEHEGQRLLWERNLRGQEVRRTFNKNLMVSTVYNNYGRIEEQLSSQPVLEGSTPQYLSRRQYHYDSLYRLQHLEDVRWGAVDYAYSVLGGLSQVTKQDGTTLFDCDVLGSLQNRTHIPPPPGGPNGMVDNTPTAPWSLAQGNVLRRTNSHEFRTDANHRRVEKRSLSSKKADTYVWDCRDRLRQFRHHDGTTYHYSYDAFGRRVEKRQSHPLSEINREERVTEFVWDGDEIAMEIDSQTGTRCHVHHPHSMLPLLQSQNQQVFLVGSDPTGTVRELFSANGELLWSVSYTAWGAIEQAWFSPDNTSKISSPFRLLGQYWDEESSLSATRFRYWDPQTACWISPDLLGIAGGFNLFGFNSVPINHVDPLGLSACDWAEELKKVKAAGGKVIHVDEMNATLAKGAGDERIWLGPYGGKGLVMMGRDFNVPMKPGLQFLEGQIRTYGGRTLQNLPYGIEHMRPAVDGAGQIVFNMPRGGLSEYPLTQQEYNHIMSNPDLIDRTVFVYGGTF